jgi:hypothetical protein
MGVIAPSAAFSPQGRSPYVSYSAFLPQARMESKGYNRYQATLDEVYTDYHIFSHFATIIF